MDYVEEFLAHHGVKGMKWGVRRSRNSVVSPSKRGSETHASEDSKKANKAHSTAKSHGTAALSNKELQDLVNRMNLEQQYSRLQTGGSQKSAGAKFAKELLVNVAKQQVMKIANDQAAKQVAKLMVKATVG